MTQRHFIIGFVILLVIAVIVLGYSSLSQSSGSLLPSPSASVGNLSLVGQSSPGLLTQPGDKTSSQITPSSNTRKQYAQYPGDLTSTQLKGKMAEIQTNKGNIEFQIYPEATKAASNFIFLANDHFFDGVTFHRVESGFVIQGGDPTGTGNGGPGYKFTEDNLVYKTYSKGVVAMAKTATDPAGSGGSQFFIMLDEKPLPPDYVIFGKVTSGQAVVDKIQVGDVMKQVTIKPVNGPLP